MQLFVGTKVVLALPMTRQEYNDYRGWSLAENEDGTDPGYLVEYKDGGESNHPNHKGYISWSPKTVFDKSYRQTYGLTFSEALEALKAGYKVARAGWNGKGMWLLLVPGSPNIKPVAGTPYSNAGITSEVSINPHIDMRTATGEMQPGWLASQTDMLADDWKIIS